MNLLAYLERRPPPKIPAGIGRVHNMDNRGKAIHPGHIRNAEISASKRLQNIERVFESIARGVETQLDIADDTGLSNATVQKALHALEDWQGGARIIRRKTSARHFFKVKS